MNRTKANKPIIRAQIFPDGFSAKVFPGGTTPEDHHRLKAALYLWSTRLLDKGNKVDWSGPGMDDVGDELKKLLLPVVTLKAFGTVAENDVKIADAKKTITTAKDFPGQEQLVSDLEKFVADDLEKRRAGLATVEAILGSAGWKFNPATRKATRIRGGRGKSFFVACVWAIYTAKHREKQITIYTRQKIAADLAPYFDEDELSPASGAPIDHAIRKGKTRSR